MKTEYILGIDPGTGETGYGIIAVRGQQMSEVRHGVIHLRKYADHYERLRKIFSRVSELIDSHGIHEVALEAPFYGKNVQSMLKLGRAQGVAMAAALGAGLPIAEYFPRNVKQSVTGNGNASKEQVAKMLKTLLSMKALPEYLDATDALAVAVCHVYRRNTIQGGAKSWKSFLRDNPDRMV